MVQHSRILLRQPRTRAFDWVPSRAGLILENAAKPRKPCKSESLTGFPGTIYCARLTRLTINSALSALRQNAASCHVDRFGSQKGMKILFPGVAVSSQRGLASWQEQRALKPSAWTWLQRGRKDVRSRIFVQSKDSGEHPFECRCDYSFGCVIP